MNNIEKEATVFEFGPHINATLEKLSSKMETTKGEIIRKALGLYDEVYKEINERGGEVTFNNKKDGIRTLVLG